jgi:hypothetical protein
MLFYFRPEDRVPSDHSLLDRRFRRQTLPTRTCGEKSFYVSDYLDGTRSEIKQLAAHAFRYAPGDFSVPMACGCGPFIPPSTRLGTRG